MIQFLREFRGLQFAEAAREAGREDLVQQGSAGPRVPRRAAPARQAGPELRVFEPHAFAPPPAQWQEKARVFAAWAHERLLERPDVLGYLAARGISRETAVRFGLGYNPETLYRPRESWGLAPEKRSNGRDKKLWLPAGIVIPYEYDGVMHRVRIRQDDPVGNSGKYIVIAGGSGAPMCITPHARAYVVVEAELDGMAIDQAAGDLVGVIALGSVSIGPDPAQHAMLQQTRSILVALDWETDQGRAGANAVRNTAAKWLNTYTRAELAPVPVGKDPGDYYQAGGDLREWLLACLPPTLQPVEQSALPEPQRQPEPISQEQPPHPAPRQIGPEGVVLWPDGTWGVGVLREMCRGMRRAEITGSTRALADLDAAIRERGWVLLAGRAKLDGRQGPALVLDDDEDDYQRGRAGYLWDAVRQSLAQHIREVRR